MGRLEIDLVNLTLQRAVEQGKVFADASALRSYLRDEIHLGDEFLEKLTADDLINCLLRQMAGRAVAPPKVPTPPASSSIDPHSESASMVDESMETNSHRPSIDSSVG
jgi:hypothetical protein